MDLFRHGVRFGTQGQTLPASSLIEKAISTIYLLLDHIAPVAQHFLELFITLGIRKSIAIQWNMIQKRTLADELPIITLKVW